MPTRSKEPRKTRRGLDPSQAADYRTFCAYARSQLAQRAVRRWIIDYWAIARTIEILQSYEATRTIPAVMVTRWWFGEPMAPRHVEAILRIVPLVERRRIKELLDTKEN